MNSGLDDTGLTAYALGELTEGERAVVESLLARSEEARDELEQIRRTAASLREALRSAPAAQLTPEQRRVVEAEAAHELFTRPRTRQRWVLWASLATAVAALFAVAVPSLMRTRVDPARANHSAPLRPATAGPSLAGEEAATPSSGTLDRAAYERLRSLGYLDGDTRPGESPSFPFAPAYSEPFNTEAYDHIVENPFTLVSQDPRSTFSADVDTASYSIVRRFLNGGHLPPKDAVRIEELINYFPYSYEPPHDGRPFAVHMDIATCPWKTDHRLVRIALKGRELPEGRRPPSNLVFLLDVSGSMDEPNKLPLVKASMRLLVDKLTARDRVAIVVYAGAEGLALPSTPASERSTIMSAIESLEASGSTHASAGILLAYKVAAQNYLKGGVNRVILATDGDFNVGITNQGDLIRLIEEKAKSGVALTALGFGMGNLKDSTLQKLADHGNGNYAYIDTLSEARKVLVEQIGATLVTIAKDVKLQVEFNPRRAKAYRLIGYEKRIMAHRDFNDDSKDGGEIGAGHTITALYEVVPPGAPLAVPGVDPLKYQEPARPVGTEDAGELLTLKLRYKEPDGDRSTLTEVPLKDANEPFAAASDDFRFAAAVAAFGMTLRDSPNKGSANFDSVQKWAAGSLGDDKGGLRAEFLHLVEEAGALSPKR